MKNIDETWFPASLAPAHRAQLEALASQAEWLSKADLEKLVSMMTQLHDIDQAREKEAAQEAAIREHYERQARKEVAEALRLAENERQIRRARIAAALNIDPSEVDLG